MKINQRQYTNDEIKELVGRGVPIRPKADVGEDEVTWDRNGNRPKLLAWRHFTDLTENIVFTRNNRSGKR